MGRKRRRCDDDEARHTAARRDDEGAVADNNSERKRRCATLATDGPLTPQEIEAFVRDGFVRLRGAFSSETAAACRALIWRRLAADGILESDPRTWVERHGIPGSSRFA